RAAELEQRSAEHENASRFAEALPPAEELWQLRRRAQGDDHWETGDARRRVELLRRGAALPPEARADFLAALRLPDEAAALRRPGSFARAEQVHRQVLDLRRRAVGAKYLGTAMAYNNLAL